MIIAEVILRVGETEVEITAPGVVLFWIVVAAYWTKRGDKK